MSYTYEYATVDDGVEIAHLLENVEFKDEISIAYCRRPNAVVSLANDGDYSTFVVARDTSGAIIATGGCVIKGDVAYLTGLRAVKRANIPKGYALLREFCSNHGVKLTYTTILEENTVVQKMLEKPRAKLPNYLRHSTCMVNIIKKGLKIKDDNQLILKDGYYLLINPQGRELAKGKAVEQWDDKQYVVKHYGAKLRVAKLFFRWIPTENEVLKFFTLRDVHADDQEALESFLRHSSRLPLDGSFFLYGGEDCPVKSLKYRSVVYIVDWDKTITDASKISLDIEIADL